MVLQQNKHVDEWNKTEDPNTSTHNYSKPTLEKVTKHTLEKRQFLQQMVLGKLNIHKFLNDIINIQLTLNKYQLQVNKKPQYE